MQSTPRTIKIAPSILAADFAQLGRAVTAAAEGGAEYIHIDVMDGRFVPNISIGIPVVKALRPLADELNVQLDVHLMIVEPEKYVEAFAEAGADRISVHVETSPHLHRTLQHITQLGKAAGVAINPATPLITLEEVLPLIDTVLVMSVNPGFGGQRYIPETTGKIRRLKDVLRAAGARAEIEIDGGVNLETVAEIVAAGADVLVAGSAVFKDWQIAQNIAALRQTAQLANGRLI